MESVHASYRELYIDYFYPCLCLHEGLSETINHHGDWIWKWLHVCGASVFQGFMQQLRQIVGRMSSGPRGAGLGVKLLLGAGALAYGVKEATYTGT